MTAATPVVRPAPGLVFAHPLGERYFRDGCFWQRVFVVDHVLDGVRYGRQDYACRGTVLVSVDNGRTWTRVVGEAFFWASDLEWPAVKLDVTEHVLNGKESRT